MKSSFQNVICDTKSLYTNSKRKTFLKAIKHWIEKLQNNIALISQFSTAFILEGLSIISKDNYFDINNLFHHQIKGTTTGTIFAVVGSNLTAAYCEVLFFHFYLKLVYEISSFVIIFVF